MEVLGPSQVSLNRRRINAPSRPLSLQKGAALAEGVMYFTDPACLTFLRTHLLTIPHHPTTVAKTGTLV